MCVVALAIGAHPEWPLLLIGNRDEFHARPSAPLARWEDAPHIIGGRDLRSGGSWLGVSERGRLAVVTNIRSDILPDPNKASRGALVADYLRGAGDYDNLRESQLDEFNGFHLMTIGSDGCARHASNRPGPMLREMAPGIHGFANEQHDAACHRRERLAQQLRDWVDSSARDPFALFALLRQGQQAGEAGHPNFLNGDEYGTRCSTIVGINSDGEGRIYERRFGPAGTGQGESDIAFRWG